MEVSPADIKEYLELLEETPRRIAAVSQNLEDARLHLKPEAEAWSPNDVLAHLRACADMWGKSMRAMIEQDHPTLRYISPRTWVRKTNYPTLDFHHSLEAFTRQREELVGWLKALEIEDWSRGATFTGTVRGRQHTVLSYARRMAYHESEHCEQIEGLLKANQFAAAVQSQPCGGLGS